MICLRSDLMLFILWVGSLFWSILSNTWSIWLTIICVWPRLISQTLLLLSTAFTVLHDVVCTSNWHCYLVLGTATSFIIRSSSGIFSQESLFDPKSYGGSIIVEFSQYVVFSMDARSWLPQYRYHCFHW